MARPQVPHKRGIYKITNIINNKLYIGSSIHITKRWWEHKKWLRLGKHINNKMQNSWNFHGENNFLFEVFEEMKDSTSKEIFAREQELIDLYYDDGKNCYNLSKKADGPDTNSNKIPILQIDKNTDEIIKKWDSAADAERGLPFEICGIRAACKGRKITAGGFKWRYSDPELADKYKVKEGQHGGHGKRKVLCLKDNKIYDSLEAAAKFYGVKYTQIISVCSGIRKHTKGLKFKYVNDTDTTNNIINLNFIEENNKNLQSVYSSDSIICKMCDIGFVNIRGLASHLQFFHKVKTEDYTIDYLFGGVKPSCKYSDCKNDVRYVSFGYKDYCKDHSFEAESLAGVKGQGIKKQMKLEMITELKDKNQGGLNITSKLDPYSYGDTVILEWKGKEITKEFTASLTPEDRELLVEDLFMYYRENGFPYPQHREEEMKKDWLNLKSRSIKPDMNGNISNKNRSGMDLVQGFSYEQFYNVSSKNDPSMVEAFNNDATLRAVLTNRIVRYFGYFNIHGAMLRQGFRSTRSSAVVSNFNCLLAKYFYEKYSNAGDWVYDYSMGFGHRMIGAMASDGGRNYVACDPWDANINSGLRMKDFIKCIDPGGFTGDIELNNIGSEFYRPEDKRGKFALAFSSPPYFNKEVYDKSLNGQSTNGRDYDSWINDWWNEVVGNIDFLLKDDGYFILNMVSVLDGKRNILDDMLKVCKQYGFEEVERNFIQMSNSHFAKHKKTPEEMENFIHKSEPIVIMKRVK